MVKEFIGLVLGSLFNNKILKILLIGHLLECIFHLNSLLDHERSVDFADQIHSSLMFFYLIHWFRGFLIGLLLNGRVPE